MALPTPTTEHDDDHEPRWQLQEAKQRFSELARDAHEDGPRIVTKHGEDFVAVIPIEEYRGYREYRRVKDGVKPNFKEFLRSAPDFSILDIHRPAEPGRIIDLDREH